MWMVRGKDEHIWGWGSWILALLKLRMQSLLASRWISLHPLKTWQSPSPLHHTWLHGKSAHFSLFLSLHLAASLSFPLSLSHFPLHSFYLNKLPHLSSVFLWCIALLLTIGLWLLPAMRSQHSHLPRYLSHWIITISVWKCVNSHLVSGMQEIIANGDHGCCMVSMVNREKGSGVYSCKLGDQKKRTWQRKQVGSQTKWREQEEQGV